MSFGILDQRHMKLRVQNSVHPSGYRRPLRRLALALRSILPATIGASLCWAQEAFAGVTGVSAYGQDHYSSTDNINGIEDSQGLQNELLGVPGTIFTAGLARTEGQVVAMDFTDTFYNSSGLDFSSTEGFDRSGDAIAYYGGHGRCQAPVSTGCATSSDCTTPWNSGWYMPGVCVGLPDRSGRCLYAYNHFMTLISGEAVRYSGGDRRRQMALGETNGVTWAGVGSDGGVNVAVFSMSCAFGPGTETTDVSLFAGLMLWLGVAAHNNGDTASAGDRGQWFGWDYAQFGAGSIVADGWGNAINHIRGGQGCKMTSGINPGTGINGCGSNTAVAEGATDAEVDGLINSTWGGITQSSRKPTGSQVTRVVRTCNYDCSTYPVIL
ncbi:MAG TPA: hypothetical protein VHC69_29140 [Polyangiaceae bacterium]|nr:hypothetical protein [Polyangiaceae bacterium]